MYTYEQYLENWRSWFGDHPVGDYGFWRHGIFNPVTLERLPEKKFSEHLIELERLDEEFKVALKSKNDAEVERILNELFPHELVLLV